MSGPSELDLSDVVGRMPTGVIVISPEHDVLYANSAARQMLRPHALSPGEQLPDAWGEFPLRAYADRLFDRPVPTEEIVRHDTSRAVAVTGIPARPGDPAIVLLDDISVRQRRRQAEQEFVANAAHELLTPLTGIVAAAHVLEAGAKEVPQDRDRFIAHIARECDRLARIARALLILARAQSGEHPPRLEVIPLRELLEQTLNVVTGEGHQSTITRIDCAGDISVLADRDLLEQALTNLSANAVQHGAGDELHVAAGRLDRRRVAIVIADRGGHSPRDTFEPPRRFQRPGGPETGGFGLGISIAKQSLEALGGTLSYERGDGDGLRARIEIPSG
jgi:signal transduction histidine kinase